MGFEHTTFEMTVQIFKQLSYEASGSWQIGPLLQTRCESQTDVNQTHFHFNGKTIFEKILANQICGL